MWNDLSDAIVAKIKTSSEVKNSAVLDHAETITQYPTIHVTAAENQEAQFSDTERVQRAYNFNIDIYQERDDQGKTNAERILRTIVDDLITIFDADLYLNDVLRGRGFARPINGAWGYTGEQLNTRSARIVIACVVIQ